MKAARAILAWKQEDFALASGLSVTTIRNIENGSLSPRSATNSAIQRAIEDAGLELLDDDGIKRRDDIVRVFKGEDGAINFDLLLRDMRDGEGEIALALTTAECHTWFFSPKNTELLNQLNRPAAATAVKCLLAQAPVSPFVTPSFDVRLAAPQSVSRLPCIISKHRYAEIAHVDAHSPPYLVSFRIPRASRIYFEKFRYVWNDSQRVLFPAVAERRKRRPY